MVLNLKEKVYDRHVFIVSHFWEHYVFYLLRSKFIVTLLLIYLILLGSHFQ